MTIFHRNGTAVPRAVDISLGVSQCVMLIVSCTLNPIVFYYHFRKRRKSTSLLLAMLAASDFLSLLFGLPVAIYNFLKASPDLVKPPTVSDFTVTIIQLFFYRLSLFITTMMSLQRLFAVTYPRYVLKAKLVYLVLIIWFLQIVIGFVMYMFDIGISPIVAQVQKYHLKGMEGNFCVWDPMVQNVTCQLGWDDVINNFAVNLFGWALVNILTSSVTIYKLHSKRTKVHGRKSIITIVLLSISSCFMYAPAPIGAMLLANFDEYNEFQNGLLPSQLVRLPSYEITFFLIINFLPQITSVLNPIILIVRGSQLREHFKTILLHRCLRGDHGHVPRQTMEHTLVSRASPRRVILVQERDADRGSEPNSLVMRAPSNDHSSPMDSSEVTPTD